MGIKEVFDKRSRWHVEPGHVMDVLRGMPGSSVQSVVTSPPYWGLRDYGLPPIVWEGDSGCGHEWGDELVQLQRGKMGDKSTLQGGSQRRESDDGPQTIRQGAFCRGCGAWRGALGLEPSPEQYVKHIVTIFREVRRVLRKDGTVWLNLGDCYYNGDKRGAGGGRGANRANTASDLSGTPNRCPVPGLKPKDLVGIPWRVAFALQSDGWWLRSDIIILKKNPMPESITDRPTRAHEYLFLLTKSRRYYYDHKVIREPLAPVSAERIARAIPAAQESKPKHPYKHEGKVRIGREAIANPDRVWHDPEALERMQSGRNRRDVWEISSEPFPEAHFAVFPTSLVEPCILAGSKHGDIILDPFAGAGTTGLVALRLQRRFIGIELSRSYVEMARRRIIEDNPLFHASPGRGTSPSLPITAPAAPQSLFFREGGDDRRPAADMERLTRK